MNREQLIAFATENAGRRVRWLGSSRQYVITGYYASHDQTLIVLGRADGSGALVRDWTSYYGSYYHKTVAEDHEGYEFVRVEDITLLDNGYKVKWQRLGITRGLEKLDAVRAEVLQAG